MSGLQTTMSEYPNRVPDSTSSLYGLFAKLFEYPTPALSQQVRACVDELTAVDPTAAESIAGFCRQVEQIPLERMEEIYTSTFDMQPVCYPYIGYQLFGESYKRGAFMAQLNHAFSKTNFSAGNELPDHISVVLRFLAIEGVNDKFNQTLLDEGLIPTLEKMANPFQKDDQTVKPIGGGNPYAAVVSALLHVLTIETEKEGGYE